MKLSPEAIKDFQEAYKQDFGKEITDTEAEKMGERLIALFGVIYRPIPKSAFKDQPATSHKQSN